MYSPCIQQALNALHVQQAAGYKGIYMAKDDTLTIAGTASGPSV